MIRLLPFWVADGLTQMAADEAMLEALKQGYAPASLRFYRWERPTLSLGFHQRQLPAHWNGFERVRRPTGGRAVWHRGDLTYALAVPCPSGSTGAIYAQLSHFLIVGLARLGIELHSGRGGSEYVRHPGCFSSATSADLLWQGRKLIGSALVRRGGTVLQHGSIQIQPDRMGLATLFPEQAPTALVGLAEIQPDIDELQVAEVLAAACAQVFACPVIASEWSDWERRFIRSARARWAIG